MGGLTCRPLAQAPSRGCGHHASEIQASRGPRLRLRRGWPPWRQPEWHCADSESEKRAPSQWWPGRFSESPARHIWIIYYYCMLFIWHRPGPRSRPGPGHSARERPSHVAPKQPNRQPDWTRSQWTTRTQRRQAAALKHIEGPKPLLGLPRGQGGHTGRARAVRVGRATPTGM